MRAERTKSKVGQRKARPDIIRTAQILSRPPSRSFHGTMFKAFTATVAHTVHLSSPGSNVATFQHKSSTGLANLQLQLASCAVAQEGTRWPPVSRNHRLSRITANISKNAAGKLRFAGSNSKAAFCWGLLFKRRSLAAPLSGNKECQTIASMHGALSSKRCSL